MSARIRTGYSFRKAAGSLADVLKAVQHAGFSRAPITDTASTFGWVRWTKLCKKAEITPVFGVELGVSPDPKAKRPSVDYWTFLSRDSLAPIHSLIGVATEQFRYEPLLSVAQGAAATGVSIIVGSASPVEEIPALPHLRVALGPSSSIGFLRKARAAGHRFVAVSDNRFPADGGHAVYEIICGRNASMQSYPQWILTDKEWAQELHERDIPEEWITEAIAGREEFFAASTAHMGLAEMVHPPRPATLEKMCRDGAKRLGCDLKDPVYAERLERELSLIKTKEFEDYFYLVADICQWARQRMIVGPARGSSCGSLVCYLLGITSIDPIPFGLIFERFIDINRADYPDIDIDFSEKERHRVFEYVKEKYGNDHVARLGTVAMYQPRSSLNEVAAALDIPKWEMSPVLDSIIDRSSGDARALQATEDTLKDTEAGRSVLAKYPEIIIAAKMEGHPSHAGQHAAGIVITANPVEEVVAVDHRTGATMCDKKDAEELNLLKVDALGLTQLSIFEDALDLAGLPRDHLFSIPLDDPKAFEVLNAHRYAGIFQFNGLALQSITNLITVKGLSDIVDITALARPGPLTSGGTVHWINVKNGTEPETYPHEAFREQLESTVGVVVYQEQVMQIGREIGGLSWEDVTALRKAMSKSLGKEFFDQYGDKWKAGARLKGIPDPVLDKVWDDLCAYGSWAFNKSHSVAYGIISYWCCWLKGHYPLEFAAATLTHTDSPETQIKLLRELAAEGVSYVPVDKELSKDKWTVATIGGKRCLVGPLSNVLGVGPKMQQSILSARARREPMPDRAAKLLARPRTKIDSLYPIRDRLRAIMPDPAKRNIHSLPTNISDVLATGKGEFMVFATPEKINPRDENEQIRIAGRDGKILDGPTRYLNMRITDDTGTMLAKVNRFKFEAKGMPILERGRAGKAIYAFKGKVPEGYQILIVDQVRYLGDLDEKIVEEVEETN